MFAVDWLLADDAALWSAVPAGSRDFGCTAALSRLSCGADDGGGVVDVLERVVLDCESAAKTLATCGCRVTPSR